MDSREYLTRLSNSKLLSALTQGHPPLHFGYILLLWPFIQIVKLLKLNYLISIIKIINSLFALAALWLFSIMGKRIFDQKTAYLATLFVTITPIFWITNVAILSEAVYLFLFLFSLFLAQQYLIKKQKQFLVLSATILGLAYLTHQIVLIFLPAYGLLLIKSKSKKQKLIQLILALVLSLIIANFILAWLYTFQGVPFPKALKFTLSSKIGDLVHFRPLTLGLARITRNWLILSLRSFSNLLVILGSIGWFSLLKQGRKRAIALACWFLPSIIAAQCWDGLLMGRHLLLAVFPLSLTVAYLVKKRKVWQIILILNLAFTSLGAVWLINEPLPASLNQQLIDRLPKNGLLIESHFLRPWISYSGQLMFVNEPNSAQNFEEEIDNFLKQNKTVFITSQALSDPYAVYAGPFIHPLSLSFSHPAKLESLTSHYYFLPVATVSAKKHLTIYQITGKASNLNFKSDTLPKWHRNRLDYFDPLSQLWFFLAGKISL